MRKPLLLLALLASPGLSIPVAQATPEEDAAYTYVLRQKVGQNLTSIAWVVIIDSKPYDDIKKKLGTTGAQDLVTRELQAVLPPYQAEWNSNLAYAYSRHFTAVELKSLTAEGQASMHARKLREKQGDIGQDMIATAEPVLKAFINKALANAVAVAATPR